jgi:ribosomal-protein-alanine N-acetyltransferase
LGDEEFAVSVLDRLLRKDDAPRDEPGNPLLVIDRMERRDLREVMPIEEAIYPKPWTERVFIDEIEMMRRGQRLYLVGRVGRTLVGYCGLLFADDAAHVTNIAVHPDWRSRGIATEFMLELAERAIEAGFGALTLEVRHTNVAAQELYRRFGFVPAGVRKRYYENTDDAIVMWCQDIQSEAFADRLRSIESTRPRGER